MLNFLKDETSAICNMLVKKRKDYGDNYHDTRIEYPLAICLRLTDKVRRLKTLKEQSTAPNFESIEDNLRDIIGYALLELYEMECERNAQTSALPTRGCEDTVDTLRYGAVQRSEDRENTNDPQRLEFTKYNCSICGTSLDTSVFKDTHVRMVHGKCINCNQPYTIRRNPKLSTRAGVL